MLIIYNTPPQLAQATQPLPNSHIMSTSTLTIASLPRIQPSTLRTLISSSTSITNPPPSDANSATDTNPTPTLAIIDVRDSDHIGGHIATSMHVASSTLDYAMPQLVRTLRETDVVVFHCMLSQQRGPGAALRYMRQREKMVGKGSVGLENEGEGEGEAGKGNVAEEMREQKDADENEESAEAGKVNEKDWRQKQRIYVLEGGFQAWQQALVYSIGLWTSGGTANVERLGMVRTQSLRRAMRKICGSDCWRQVTSLC